MEIFEVKDCLFGGKIVILGEDFRQLLPRSICIRSEVINLSIKSSILRNVFITCTMRAMDGDMTFSKFV